LKHGAYVDIRNGAGYTPLISAASKGDMVMVAQLIKMKVRSRFVPDSSQ
jgi:ankyrin repeat protein